MDSLPNQRALHASSAKRRPRGVWVLCGFFLLAAGIYAASPLLVESQVLILSMTEERYLQEMGLLRWFLIAFKAGMSMAVAMQLFRLKRTVVAIVAANLAVDVIGFVASAAGLEPLNVNLPVGSVGTIFSVLLSFVALLYANGLREKGLLSKRAPRLPGGRQPRASSQPSSAAETRLPSPPAEPTASNQGIPLGTSYGEPEESTFSAVSFMLVTALFGLIVKSAFSGRGNGRGGWDPFAADATVLCVIMCIGAWCDWRNRRKR